ncbi:MAG: hypothetical protein LJE70_12905 [Chromatiaceae bacterium]|nr:hypothetical protein [Chromatiaceae bacterium]
MKKFLLVVVLIVLAGAGFTMWKYSEDTGRTPWEWTAQDWNNWMTFTKHESQQLGMQAKEGGQATWRWVGKNTPVLFEKSKELLARLGYQETEQPVAEPSSGAGAPAPSVQIQPVTVDRPTDPLDVRSNNYKYGKEWLARGIAEWKVSLIHPGAAERAKTNFEKAISSFDMAKSELGDSASPDLSQLEQSARDYLSDTEERLQQIHQSGQ